VHGNLAPKGIACSHTLLQCDNSVSTSPCRCGQHTQHNPHDNCINTRLQKQLPGPATQTKLQSRGAVAPATSLPPLPLALPPPGCRPPLLRRQLLPLLPLLLLAATAAAATTAAAAVAARMLHN
jgi:hypothetical protein